jgi:hypothetical protein
MQMALETLPRLEAVPARLSVEARAVLVLRPVTGVLSPAVVVVASVAGMLSRLVIVPTVAGVLSRLVVVPTVAGVLSRLIGVMPGVAIVAIGS